MATLPFFKGKCKHLPYYKHLPYLACSQMAVVKAAFTSRSAGRA